MDTISTERQDELPYLINRIMKPNYDGIRLALPHRLYADGDGSWMEIYTKYIPYFYGERRDSSGIIIGIKRSGNGGNHTETFFLDAT